MLFDPDSGYPSAPGRRRALRAAASLGAVPLSAAAPWVAAAPLAFAPAVFDVDADRALIWLSANDELRVHVRWGLSPDALTQRSAELVLDKARDFTGHVALQRLPAGRTVHFRAYVGDSALPDSGRFSTPRTTGQNFVLAFSGDMEEKYKPFRIFDAMATARPDYFVHLGDTCYADHPKRDFSPTLSHYRRKHANVRADRPLQAFMSQCATYAIWDDHEIENDAHGGLAHLPIAEQVFREYWPCTTVEKTGLYRAVSLSPEVDLIIVDTRRFRSVQAMPDGPEKTMLGTQQKLWFLDRLRHSKATFKIVATSVPFHGSSQDAWGNYKTERDEISTFIKRERIANVVMISADYHFARDWSNKRTGIHEFMAGPLATFRAFDKTPEIRERHSKGPHFVFGDDFNFGLLSYDGKLNSLTVSYRDDVGKVLFETRIAPV
jgi:alkaline phosphatase D